MKSSFSPTLRATVACVFLALSTAGAAELVHLWDFEGSKIWNDKAGMAHGLVPMTTTLNTSTGHNGGRAATIGSAITGTNDYVPLDGTRLFQPAATPFTIIFWFRMPADGTTDPRGIFDFSGNGQDGPQSLYIGTSGELAVRVDVPGSGFSLAKIAAPLDDGQWHFVAATYDPAAGLNVHLDGFGVDASAAATAGNVPMNPFSYLGAFNVTGNPEAKGLGGDLDDFAIFAGLLTEEEIAGLYAGTIRIQDFLPGIGEILSVERDGDGRVTIVWPSIDGAVYAVSESENLLNWIELTDSVVGTGETARFSVTPVPAPPEYFLQVRRIE
jgi:hypothetical protein